MFQIRNSAFERENRYVLSCPYCKKAHFIIIEDGRLVDEDKASKYLKDLPAAKLQTEAWLELLTKE
jgi:hypothetical protein